MRSIQKFITIIAFPMILLLPFWITFGRGLLGSGGWGTFALLLGPTPLLFALLLVIYLLIRFRSDVIDTKLFGKIDSMLLIVLYISLFLFGLFFVDGGDTADSINSVAHTLGITGTLSTSDALSTFFSYLSILTIALLLIVAIIEKARGRELQLR